VNSDNESLALPCYKNISKKTLLSNISGIFKSGEISAIMGPSGAGKTTLLNVLACRVSLQNQEGEIRANNIAYEETDFGDFANYVMQNDIFLPTMTVRETLRFAADLKIAASNS
jgi:ABC-type multidrug transport system ATPase subunit